MDEKRRLSLMRDICWDYHCDPQGMLDVVDGKSDSCPPFTRETLFARCLNRMPWNDVTDLWGGSGRCLGLWSPKVRRMLWPESIRRRYDRVFDILSGKAVPVAEWDTHRCDAYWEPVLPAFHAVNATGAVPVKIDLVADVPEHFGKIHEDPCLGPIDSIENILTNKIGAVLRMEPKDVADIREICRHFAFNWQDMFGKAIEKEIGIDPCEVSDIIGGCPQSKYEEIKWQDAPGWEAFSKDIHTISQDIIGMGENSLAARTMEKPKKRSRGHDDIGD